MKTRAQIHRDRFFWFLGMILLGYAVDGKGVAYLGVPPLFVGEIVMAYGVFALASTENWSRLLRTAWVWPLLGYMAWCCARTLPFINIWGADALRDGAIWMWGTYALVIGSLMTAEPQRIHDLERQYRKFIRIALIGMPIGYCCSVFIDAAIPAAPWASSQPLILIKGGDVVVHLTGILAYSVMLGGGLNEMFVTIMIILDLMLTFTGRAAMVTFSVGAMVVVALRPTSRIILGIFPTLMLGVLLLWMTDLHISGAGGSRSDRNERDVSADQIFQNIYSIFNDSGNRNLAGSREWRLKWWDTIMNYTFDGPYFWTGKGFGVNLADDDGFQVEADHSLRSPHNGHLTQLARAGVPGFALWILTHVTLAGGLAYNAYMAHRYGRTKWVGAFVFLLVYWSAFMTNAAFDVYLEGPLGGIWMWSIYGVGLGAIWLHENCPQVLEEPSDMMDDAPTVRRRREFFAEPVWH